MPEKGYETLFREKTDQSAWSDCECGRHSAYAEEFVEWLVNRERANCIREARERAATLVREGNHQSADALIRFADEMKALEEFKIN